MVEKTFSNKNVSNNIRNQIVTVKFFCGWNCRIDFLTVTYVEEVLTYILRNLLIKLENCIELLTDRI